MGGLCILIRPTLRMQALSSPSHGRSLIEHHCFNLKVGVQPFDPSLTADTRLLEATKSDGEIRCERVMPNRSCPQSPAHRIGSLRIIGEH
jgi:hypothetical protein